MRTLFHVHSRNTLLIGPLKSSIIIGSLMPRVVTSFSTDAPDWLLDRRLWILISMTILCPVAFLRKLDSLKYISYIALIAVANLVSISLLRHTSCGCLHGDLFIFGVQIFVVVYKFFVPTGMPPRPPIKYVDLSPRFISSLPVQVSSLFKPQ